MIVAELMTRNPATVRTTDTLEVACTRMETGRFRQVPVLDGERLVGIVTDRDTRQHIGQWAHTRVDAVMSTHPFSVRPSAPVEMAAHILMTNKIGSLPVVEDGKLVGIITASDMLRALEALLGTSSDGGSRIDLNVDGAGEISAAASLVQTVCPVLAIGTYRRQPGDAEVLYVRVPSTSAERAVHVLKRNGFRILAVHF
jgi:acetoin utilization protein AcuB